MSKREKYINIWCLIGDTYATLNQSSPGMFQLRKSGIAPNSNCHFLCIKRSTLLKVTSTIKYSLVYPDQSKPYSYAKCNFYFAKCKFSILLQIEQ